MSELGKIEREIRQLEVAIYDLKTKNNELQKALDQVIEDRDAYHDEIAELLKDKERLDWLLRTQSWLSMNQLGTRNDIDKEMEDAQ